VTSVEPGHDVIVSHDVTMTLTLALLTLLCAGVTPALAGKSTINVIIVNKVMYGVTN